MINYKEEIEQMNEAIKHCDEVICATSECNEDCSNRHKELKGWLEQLKFVYKTIDKYNSLEDIKKDFTIENINCMINAINDDNK